MKINLNAQTQIFSMCKINCLQKSILLNACKYFLVVK